jgi:hypothetical protein
LTRAAVQAISRPWDRGPMGLDPLEANFCRRGARQNRERILRCCRSHFLELQQQAPACLTAGCAPIPQPACSHPITGRCSGRGYDHAIALAHPLSGISRCTSSGVVRSEPGSTALSPNSRSRYIQNVCKVSAGVAPLLYGCRTAMACCSNYSLLLVNTESNPVHHSLHKCRPQMRYKAPHALCQSSKIHVQCQFQENPRLGSMAGVSNSALHGRAIAAMTLTTSVAQNQLGTSAAKTAGCADLPEPLPSARPPQMRLRMTRICALS